MVRAVVPNSVMPKGVEHRKWIVPILTPILCAMALLLGIVALGRATRTALHDRDAYTITFTDLECAPPEGTSRRDFLGEVQSLCRLPDHLHLLDEDVTARLARAFAAHPWVESVRRVDVRGPGSKIHVDLAYRNPVLVVGLSPARAVDSNGVLLPVAAVRSNVPVLISKVADPVGPPGSRWGDPCVTAAAASAAFLKPHLSRLRLNDCDLEIVQGEIVFCKPGVRVVWGHAPGQEGPGEATAQVKLQRLLDYQAGHDGLESLEHDVRLLAYQGHFPLFPARQP